MGGGPTLGNQTIRMVAHANAAGSQVRIRLSNLRGTTPLAVGAVSIAAQSDGATPVAGTLRTVTFSQAKTFSIPAGADVVSDPIPMSVAAEQNVLVSVYLPQGSPSPCWHSDAFDRTWLSAAGDHTGDIGNGNYTQSTTSWYYLAGLDVIPSEARGTVVAFGDSITDGYSTPTSAYQRWPDAFARRLAEDRHPMGVVDAGIGGNKVLTDAPNNLGIAALKRFGHDALEQPGVRTVILMEGINDIGNDAGPNGGPLTAQDLINGYKALIDQAHRAGVRILGGTMLPFKGAGYYNDAREAIRQAANQWIRTGGAFDGVVDFDAATRDPSNPAALHPKYDCGDHLHPNRIGMQAMANAVDLKLVYPTK
ncbi:SGNH/GDSL hydrolase family protein [Pendulispora brunnea]|uniref:SGNH/GDSL hydrolase family protein n=1 Tax=Pendulispora brunnea TaxID=2905690 RepID=A0ABZ2JZJ1_9BACT